MNTNTDIIKSQYSPERSSEYSPIADLSPSLVRNSPPSVGDGKNVDNTSDHDVEYLSQISIVIPQVKISDERALDSRMPEIVEVADKTEEEVVQAYAEEQSRGKELVLPSNDVDVLNAVHTPLIALTDNITPIVSALNLYHRVLEQQKQHFEQQKQQCESKIENCQKAIGGFHNISLLVEQLIGDTRENL
ncbi:MAG: hypothetical protein LBB16_01655 [Puniceicoccales bacterium]|jgi:hypothetical protein|nr:hypothetical protein [Puniceicoccales bacterium]